MIPMIPILVLAASLITSFPALAAGDGMPPMTSHPGAIFALAIFLLSYVAVLFEEKTHLRKSKPVLLGAGIIWVAIGVIAPDYGIDHQGVHDAVFAGLEEYGSLLLFLLSAMTYISVLQNRLVFDALRAKLVCMGLNMRQLFWVTGLCAFFLSPIADNLTTALVMGAVVMAVGANDPKFIAIACINIVSAANAGGAFSPFGDITTLMVWQAGKIPFFDFFPLFVPALVNFLLPAAIMSFFIHPHQPIATAEHVRMRRGAKTVITLGLLTIAMAVGFEQILGLPPFMGMMMGMGLLMMFAWYIRYVQKGESEDLDVLKLVATAEWDTLLFFYGVMFCVGGLAFLGYLNIVSTALYGGLGADVANIIMGLASAVIDNIPVMFAILSMNPDMPEFQWLLVTLACGVGGTMLSIGSAAGVALMGVARGQYTFMSHLKWTPVLILGYAAAIAAHYLLNG